MEKIWEQVVTGLVNGAALVAVVKIWLTREIENQAKREKAVDDRLSELKGRADKADERIGAVEREQAGIAATFATHDDLDRLEDRFERRIDKLDR